MIDSPFRAPSGRLRTPWRLFVAASFFLSVSVSVSVVGLSIGLVPPPGSAFENFSTVVVPHLVNGLALAIAVAIAARYLDRRSLDDLGLSIERLWWRDLLVGLSLGFGLIAALYLVGVSLGVYEPTFSPTAPDGYTVLGAFALVTAFVVVVGLYEELIFRGYLLRNLAEGLHAVLEARVALFFAVLISSAGFGAVHGLNPEMTPLGVATITVAGVLLGVGYALTGRLALPIGFHITWNFAHFVFGLPVSGLDLEIGLFETERVGPTLLHGGPVGPEGGVLGLAAALLGCLLVLGYGLAVGSGSRDLVIPTLRGDVPPRDN